MSPLHPFLVNPRTNELYLPLPSPLSHIVITEPRAGDVDAYIRILNDERVYKWLNGPPFPYERVHAEGFNKRSVQGSRVFRSQVESGARYVDGCPIRAIREVQEYDEDGVPIRDVYIGDIMLDRESPDVPWVRDGKEDENERKETGDPSVLWSFGYYLDAAYHGQGIMSLAMRSVLFSFALPRMNCRRAMGVTFKGNVGSRRVFEKNGFVFVEEIEGAVTKRSGEVLGDEEKDVWVLRWEWKE